MNIWKKLQNPFALVGQGFVVGALLLLVSQHQTGEAKDAVSEAPSAPLVSFEARS